jgi:hypothetical protein
VIKIIKNRIITNLEDYLIQKQLQVEKKEKQILDKDSNISKTEENTEFQILVLSDQSRILSFNKQKKNNQTYSNIQILNSINQKLNIILLLIYSKEEENNNPKLYQNLNKIIY